MKLRPSARARVVSPVSPVQAPAGMIYTPPAASSPIVPPVVGGVVSGDVETWSGTVNISQVPNALTANAAPLRLFRTSRRWRALDVYAATDYTEAGATPAFLTIAVYAINQGTRVLVASGRVKGNGPGTQPVFQYAAAARVVAEAFEVAVYKSEAAADPAMAITVSVVASDEANEPGSKLSGVVTSGFALGPTELVNGGPADLEPVLLSIANRSPALRYLQICTGAGGAGTTQAEWSIAANEDLIVYQPEVLRRFRRSVDFCVRPSSTSGAYGAVADCSVAVWCR